MSPTEPEPAGPAIEPELSASATPPEDPAAAAQRLKELWPALFTGAPRPLKLRIQADIQQRAPGVFTKPVLSAFLRRYTGSTSYLMALVKSSQRYDLDGQPAGDLSDEHRQAARDELARRRGLHEARRALEEQQRRNRARLLHDYERTTLTRANFCVLKGVAEAELDGLLAIAREEAAQGHDRPSHGHPPPGQRQRHEGGRPDRPRGPDRRSGPRGHGRPSGGTVQR